METFHCPVDYVRLTVNNPQITLRDMAGVSPHCLLGPPGRYSVTNGHDIMTQLIIFINILSC